MLHTFLSILPWTHWKNTALCLPFSVDSCYCDIVGQELIWQCQSEVRAAAASCIHWVSRCHCWFILNLIVDGPIRVEWGEPVQFNSTPICFPSHSQHAWCGGGCGIGNEGNIRGGENHRTSYSACLDRHWAICAELRQLLRCCCVSE